LREPLIFPLLTPFKGSGPPKNLGAGLASIT
jgi:hypothetical protein